MSQFTRTINIASENLGGSSAPTLILTFDDQPMQGIYQEYFPVVWKLSTFPTHGSHALNVTYNSQLVFVNPQVENDKIVSAETWIDINLGQKTELIELSSTTNSFTTPTSSGVGDRFIEVINNTQSRQNIGVGFDNGGASADTLLVFEHISSMSGVVAEFTPTLTAYIIVADYQENSVLRGPIPAPIIWKQNLACLKETSYWRLEYDPLSKIYSIVSA